MTTSSLSERVSQSAFDGSRLRVILLLDLYDGAQNQFLEAYEHLRRQVASVPGHVSDQLCQSIENPSQWLITSEWESAPPFLAWVNSEEHVQMVQPLHSCVRDTRSLRFSVLRETGNISAAAEQGKERRLQSAPRLGDNVVRHALTFTVKPGSEDVVAKILSGYTSPEGPGGRQDPAAPYFAVHARQPGGPHRRGRGRPAHGAAPCVPATRGQGGRGSHQPVPGAGPGPLGSRTPRGCSSPGPRSRWSIT